MFRNGERLQRKWLIYSIYHANKQPFALSVFYFQDVNQVFVTKMNLEAGESPGYRNAMREYLDFAARLEKLRVIDYELQKHIVSEKKKWRLIVEQLVDVVFLHARQNIVFRSHRDEGVSKLVNDNVYETNSGNFLEIIRLLAHYDVVLFERLQNVRIKPNKVNYLSNKSQNKIINLIGSMIKKIISEVKKAQYFTLMLDSTPDVSREDQIAEILRYVHIN